jgi:UDP-3-O-[3-hydroxymyristoyl] glucosamine N-acyltransferase
MKLSEFENQFFTVVRDGEFATMGILVSEPHMPYLCFAESESFLISSCNKADISCIICTPELAKLPALQESGKGIAVCSSPRTAFYTMHNWLFTNNPDYTGKKEKHPPIIGKECIIHPTAIIEDGVEIGDCALIEEYTVIREGCKIGNNVTLRAGSVIGGSNHIVCHKEDGTLFLVKQSGRVEIKNNIEIGYHAVVARGMFPYETTTINDNCCVDMDVLVAHNCQIGKNTMLLAQSQVCGSTKVGEDVRISPQAIVSNCLNVGDNATVALGAVAVNNIKKNEKVSGNFAIEHSKFLKWHIKKLRDTRN